MKLYTTDSRSGNTGRHLCKRLVSTCGSHSWKTCRELVCSLQTHRTLHAATWLRLGVAQGSWDARKSDFASRCFLLCFPSPSLLFLLLQRLLKTYHAVYSFRSQVTRILLVSAACPLMGKVCFVTKILRKINKMHDRLRICSAKTKTKKQTITTTTKC